MKKTLAIIVLFFTLSVSAQHKMDTATLKIKEIQEKQSSLEQRVNSLEQGFLSYKHNDLETSIGGAARFNYIFSSWDEDQKNKGGELKSEVFFVNFMSRYKEFSIHAEYRFYSKASGGAMLKNAYFQYLLKKDHRFQFGLMQVPFGNTVNSSSFYLSLAFYIGLEADDDTGLKYTYNNEHFEIDAAFFKNSDLDFGSGQPTDPSRYGVDVSGQNQETNQLNARFIWKVGDYAKSRLGVSGLYSGLYNIYTKEMGSRYSVAAHYQLEVGDWTLRTQWANYGFDPKNLSPDDIAFEGQEMMEEEMEETITVSAYGAPYRIADKGNLYTASLRYEIPLKNTKVFNSINAYGEFNYLDKSDKQFSNSQMHVLGVNLNLWKVSIYTEYILGKNHPFLGSDWTNALGAGSSSAEWNQRLNINIGFYF